VDYKKIAAEVVGKVGGNSNIVSVTHCMTRLRFVLKDNKQANDEEIKKIPGVLGVAVSGGQYQVIIGTEVSSVYTEIVNTMDVTGGGSIDVDEGDIPKEDGNLFNRFFKLISGIIFPVMGVMTAGGIIKGVLAGLTSFNILSEASGTYQILYSFADGFFYFLPVILGFSAANKFKSNPYIGATIGAALVYPSIVSLYNKELHLHF